MSGNVGVEVLDGRPLVSVVVPAYNEEDIVEHSLGVLVSYLEGLADRYRFEILVVNDGSSDETGARAEAFARMHREVQVLHHQVNFHLGQALRYAFGQANGDYIAVIDCDLSYGVEHIGRMLYAMEDNHARIVIASPYMDGGHTTNIPPLRRMASRLANRLLSRAAAGDLSTITGMVRLYDARFLRALDLRSVDSEINAEIVYKAQILQARIVEIPAHLDWSFEQTNGNRRPANLKISRATLGSLFATFLFRPFWFFIVPGLIALAMAALAGVWVVWHIVDVYGQPSSYGNSGFSGAVQNAYVQAPHAFFVAGISFVVALQLFSLGIIATQVKRYFEDLFHLGTTVLREMKTPTARG